MAFVTRSHRHLWGKNNEDPLALLFHRGLENEFAKKILLGWNKFGQNRPSVNWGLKSPEILFLPPGMVIPYIIKKELQSVFIYPLEPRSGNQTVMLPGSQAPAMILGRLSDPAILIQDLFDGLWLFQETKGSVCVIVHPDTDQKPGDMLLSDIQKIENPLLFLDEKTAHSDFRRIFSKIPDQYVKTYHAKEDLLKTLTS